MNVFHEAADRLAGAWEREAEQRKGRTPTDPVADAIASCARDLRQTMTRVDQESAYLTVAQYAGQHGVHESSVRRWCMAGELAGAQKDHNDDWRIPRDAKRQRTA